MEKNKEKPKMEAGVKSFITAIVVIFAMMVLTYALTIIIPGGYIPFWKWILSSILVLFAKDSGSMIAIIALLVVLGGIFNTLDKFGVLRLLLDKVTAKFGKSRRVLLAVIPLFFMVIGSAAGTFEAGVCNPFTVGVAQELAGLPMFSGMWYRAVAFLIIYILLMLFLLIYVRKIEKPMDEKMLEGIGSGSVRQIAYSSGSRLWKIGITFKEGVVSVLPGVLLILNFFIPSGSAKAFLLMPLIVPLAEAFDISAQLCVVAFAFGDGFSNVFYPTNPVLLISIGLANVSYGTWAKWSGKFQLINLFVTGALLLLGLAINVT